MVRMDRSSKVTMNKPKSVRGLTHTEPSYEKRVEQVQKMSHTSEVACAKSYNFHIELRCGAAIKGPHSCREVCWTT